MKNSIYFFSGTGNSLATAKKVSSKLSGNTEFQAMNESIKSVIDGDRAGVIFPVYYGVCLKL